MSDQPESPASPPNDHGIPAAASGPGGTEIEVQIERELQDSYLTYAMSTIMDRALPDVRDGLKPSQRRILVAMNDLNLVPGRKQSKCAGIVGETMKKYHPHGEGAIYPTLVNLAQEWKIRYGLVDKQGNFGSIDGDPPAAMRYTEARMSHAAVEMLDDLKLDTVDFGPNYDDSIQEPTVLPARFPNLLVNGSTGIAVGMAASIPPHNMGEILDAVVALIDTPDIGLTDLMRIVPGPDFPTGGIICGRRGIAEAYATGRGKITLRGTVEVEDLPGAGKERKQIVITSIPYQLTGETLMERIVDAVRDEKIKEISDARNESDMRNPVRIVCELKRGADPAVVEQQLYEFTPLQQTFSIINIALVNRQPRTLSLREMLRHYVDHRIVVIRRRTAHLLREAQKKAHVLEGLVFAVCDIDAVIKEIRASSTRDEAIRRLTAMRFRIAPTHKHAPLIPKRLMDRATAALPDGVSLTRVQADAIGAMRLIQLVGLEIDRLVGDYAKLVEQIEDYEAILASDERVRGIIKADCARMRERFADARRSRIEDADTDISIEDLIQEREMAVIISHQGYVKRVPLDTWKQQGRGGVGVIASDSKDEDFVEHLFVAGTHDDLLCFTNTGRVFRLKVYEVPELSRTSRGRSIVNLIELKPGETVRAFLTIKNFEKSGDFLAFVSEQGIVKRTALKDYRNVNKSGLIAVGLKEEDALLDVAVTKGDDDLLLATAEGMAIRFDENDARLMGRSAAGVKGIELADSDRVIGLTPVRVARDADGERATLSASMDLLTITEKGMGKRTPVDEYLVHPETGKPRAQSRGGKGRIDIDAGEKIGRAVAALGVHASDEVMVITSGGMLVRIPAAEIRQTGRGAQGVRVVRLKEGDSVIAAARVPGSAEQRPTDAPEAPASGPS